MSSTVLRRFIRVAATPLAAGLSILSVGTFCAPSALVPDKPLHLSQARAFLDDAASDSHASPSDLARAFSLAVSFLERAGGDDAELSWRVARAAIAVAGDRATSAADAEAALRTAAASLARLRHASISAAGGVARSAATDRWEGRVLLALRKFENVAQSVAHSWRARELFESALETDSGDAEAAHLLGLWCWETASSASSLGAWYSSLWATLPRSSLEEAQLAFERADRLGGGAWPANSAWLARVCEARGHKEASARWARATLALPPSSPADADAHRLAKDVLARTAPK